MKKFTALVALALLAIAGTGYAVTCAQDNVPAATLLVPYFRVGSNGIVGTGTGMGDIPDASGTDTLVAVTNVSAANIIIHVTVWNKYSAAVLDFNVPMTGFDVVFWSMRDILNGKLNVNSKYFQKLGASGLVGATTDPCGQVYTNSVQTNFVKTTFTRFLIGELDTDRTQAISVYKNPAFGTLFRQNVWTSLDESYDISNWLDVGAAGAGVIDNSNYSCDGVAGASVVGDFSGYVTIDVANYCTQHFPNEPAYWVNDAIATVGWGPYAGPNVLMGDVFYKDQTPNTTDNMGNISGDPAVHIEFDSRLRWGTGPNAGDKTFYGRYFASTDGYYGGANAAYSFPGDGREPLGSHYGFRYMQTSPPLVPGPTQYRTWINVWHSDTYNPGPVQTDLCGWWLGAANHDGFMDIPTHQLIIHVWDNDENPIVTSGGPSGGPTGGQLYIFLETQRLVVTPNGNVVPPTGFDGGWIDLTLPGNFQNQAYVGVEHSGVGTNMSVGHSATLLDGQFVCDPKPLINWTPSFPANTIPGGAAVQTN